MTMHRIWDYATLGKAIAKERKSQGMTQAELAEWMGITHSTLSKLENGKPVMSTVVEKALRWLNLYAVILPRTMEVLEVGPEKRMYG